MDKNTSKNGEIGTAKFYNDGSIEIIEGIVPFEIDPRLTYIKIDERVRKAATFLQRKFQAEDLRGIVKALAAIAPVIWSAFPEKDIAPMSLDEKMELTCSDK